MGRDASAMKDSQARKFKQEREQLDAAQMAAMEPMLPSLQATTEGWHRCAGGEAKPKATAPTAGVRGQQVRSAGAKS